MTKRPTPRSEFLGPPDELNYLSDMVTYFSSIGQIGSPEATALLARFAGLLEQSGLDDRSIVLQEHWALLHEVRGDMAQAIRHRERQIELIERLFAIGGPVGSVNYTFLRATMQKLVDNCRRHGQHERADELTRRIQKRGRLFGEAGGIGFASEHAQQEKGARNRTAP
jgi:hypothetical protein